MSLPLLFFACIRARITHGYLCLYQRQQRAGGDLNQVRVQRLLRRNHLGIENFMGASFGSTVVIGKLNAQIAW